MIGGVRLFGAGAIFVGPIVADTTAVALFAAGTVLVLRLWPRVGDAWGAVNARLHFRGEA